MHLNEHEKKMNVYWNRKRIQCFLFLFYSFVNGIEWADVRCHNTETDGVELMLALHIHIARERESNELVRSDSLDGTDSTKTKNSKKKKNQINICIQFWLEHIQMQSTTFEQDFHFDVCASAPFEIIYFPCFAG